MLLQQSPDHVCVPHVESSVADDGVSLVLARDGDGDAKAMAKRGPCPPDELGSTVEGWLKVCYS